MKKNLKTFLQNNINKKEWWFAVILIVTTSIFTAIYNLDKYGLLYHNTIGAAEFFYSSVLIRNIMLQITVPIIPFFVIMNKLTPDHENCKDFFKNISEYIIIITSVYFVSFAILSLVGLIGFGQSTGDINNFRGFLYSTYKTNPIVIIPYTFLYYVFCSIVYYIFGLSIYMLVNKDKNAVLLTLLAFYNCSSYILKFSFVSNYNILHWVIPKITFDLAAYDYSLMKRATELLFVLILSTLLFSASILRNRLALWRKKGNWSYKEFKQILSGKL